MNQYMNHENLFRALAGSSIPPILSSPPPHEYAAELGHEFQTEFSRGKMLYVKGAQSRSQEFENEGTGEIFRPMYRQI